MKKIKGYYTEPTKEEINSLKVTAKDAIKGAKFRNPQGTIFEIIDVIPEYYTKGETCVVTTTNETNGIFHNEIEDFVSFMNEERAMKL